MLTVMERVDLLLNAPIFAGVRTESLARLAAIAEEARFDAGQALFQENDPPREMFFIMEGEVALSGSARAEGRLERYQVAGALELLSDRPHRESARAVGPVRALSIAQQDLYDAMAEECAISRGIMQTLAGMLAQGR